MPKRKRLPKLPNYTGIAKDENKMIVQKSNPLQTLSQTPMTLPEFKILDAYLSKIDSHDEDKRYVRFEKGELEKLLGVTRILKDDLSKRLDNLFQVITIRDGHKNRGFTKIALFEKAEADLDDNGQWVVDLACTPSAMEYVFNIDNIGYLRYRLKNVVDLTSRYSYVLYLYLENNRFRKSWEIDISELKKLLNCTAETYSQYYRFNDLILKRSHKELLKKTDLRYTYEPVKKKGRTYTKIKFTIETSEEQIANMQEQQIDGQIDIFETTELLNAQRQDEEIDYGSDLANLLGGASCDNEFSVEQIRIITDLVIKIIPQQDNLKRCNYLIEQMHKMDYYNSRKTIRNRFEYLLNMLKNEVKEGE